MLINIQTVFIFVLALLISTTIAISFYKNPIHSVLTLIVAVVLQSVLFITANLEFLGLIFIIIYVGAIVVLFLFALMTFGNFENININLAKKLSVIFIFAMIFVVFIKVSTKQNIDIINIQENPDEIKNIAEIIYSKYSFEFIALGVFMLVAIIGIVSACKDFLPSNNKTRIKKIKYDLSDKTNVSLLDPGFGNGVKY